MPQVSLVNFQNENFNFSPSIKSRAQSGLPAGGPGLYLARPARATWRVQAEFRIFAALAAAEEDHDADLEWTQSRAVRFEVEDWKCCYYYEPEPGVRPTGQGRGHGH